MATKKSNGAGKMAASGPRVGFFSTSLIDLLRASMGIRFMASARDEISSVVAQLRFVGRNGGAVKTLGGFKKSHHTVPAAVNAATTAFLGKLCDGELVSEAESFFQRAREAFAYKRKDLALEVTSPAAVLAARDFTLEWSYALDAADPASWSATQTLHSVRSRDFLDTPASAEIFGGLFSELTFTLTKAVSVEAVIDAIEELGAGEAEDGAAGLRVDYPSDCRHCVVSVAGVDATVRFEGAELAMVFPRRGAPRDLLDEFLAVRSAFALTKDSSLAGILA
jgi:hypothetical protein